ncbi:MAG: hypothetical protein ABSG31_10155 [Tepidisphaeraceae bacterium]
MSTIGLWLECGNALPSRSPLAGPATIAAAFCSETQCGVPAFCAFEGEVGQWGVTDG